MRGRGILLYGMYTVLYGIPSRIRVREYKKVWYMWAKKKVLGRELYSYHTIQGEGKGGNYKIIKCKMQNLRRCDVLEIGQ